MKVEVLKPEALDSDEEFQPKHCASTRNPCKLCTPLGACLAFKGVEGALPFLHGSQGCATYIRRYLISHFREPMDIASSNFSEESAIFGGAKPLSQGLQNVRRQYEPKLIGVATTCLSETIGEDMDGMFHEYISAHWDETHPHLVHVSTPSFKGTHMDGFHAAVRSLIVSLATPGPHTTRINLFPGMVSAADLRHLKEICADFHTPITLLPDYSETMDGVSWSEYEKLPSGGTTIEDIQSAGSSRLSIEFGPTLDKTPTAASFLEERFSIPRRLMPLPIGIRATDAFLKLLETAAGHTIPQKYQTERGRLVDALVDGHKYVFEKTAIVYGEEDLVVGLTTFLREIGVIPILCASGGKSGRLEASLRAACPDLDERTVIRDGIDFATMAELPSVTKPDFFIGSSKGYKFARSLGSPLIRVGFPIHDRIGGQRILHLGYRGAQQLFDQIVNTLLESKQEASDVGYSYL